MNLDYILSNVLQRVCTNLYSYHKGMRIFSYIHVNIGWLLFFILKVHVVTINIIFTHEDRHWQT